MKNLQSVTCDLQSVTCSLQAGSRWTTSVRGIQGLYTFLWTELKTFSRLFPDHFSFIFQTQGNSEILHGLRRNNCRNYEHNELKKFSFSCLILNLQ